MKKLVFILFFFLNIFFLFAQQEVLSFKNEEVSRRVKKDSYTISNVNNNELAVVIIERKEIYAYLFNSDFSLKSELKTDNIKSKYNNALGYSLSENGMYQVLYTNENKNKFAILSLDFDNSNGRSKEIDIDLEDDVFLDVINYNNKLYLLSTKNGLTLNIKVYNNNFGFDLLKSFHLDKIGNDTNLISSKIQMGAFILAGKEISNITKIDSKVSNSIEQTSSENKLYQNGKSIILTFDVNQKETLLYTIDLENLTLDYKTFTYPKSKTIEFKNYNSFVYQDYIYQIASSKEALKLEIKDFDSNVVKTFNISRDRSISFKNSPIIQEGQTALPFVTNRKLELTRKYLRKINAGYIGVSAIKNKDHYYLTLGGFQVVTQPGMITPVNTVGSNFTGYNTTYLTYNSYSTTKSTYFNSILDLNFNHVKGKLQKNIFDQIDNFKTKLKYTSGEDLFFHNNQLYFGYFDQKGSTYHLTKF
ncbi:hypothetical protein [uncultured Lacinutrix sp.]|uniref:hypothetical protein n=1 Tax=uncultured Lacinutrix sp. TaxID=574032 RepID=UPI00261D4435|nr:hypothetical protein [uncultured Lacinutrix sp.]